MILRCDTTSFGLLVACMPPLPAGKIPPPGILKYMAGCEEGAAAPGGGGGCESGQASQRHGPETTVRQTTTAAGMLNLPQASFGAPGPMKNHGDLQTSTG